MADGSQYPSDSFDLIAIAAALGVAKRSAERRSNKEGWIYETRTTRGGPKRYFRSVSLPCDVQAALLLRRSPQPSAPPSTFRPNRIGEHIASAWRRYEWANDNLKAQAQRRLTALHAIEGLRANGLPLMQARSQVAAQLQREGIRGGSVPSLARWARDVEGAPREAWLALLLPEYVGRTVTAPCDAQVWDWYKGHYLTRARPSHASTYARVAEMAREQGWAVPSARTLNRRMDREVNHATQVLLREGPEAAARLLPPQHRDASVFGAGEAVNGDGLKFDRLWVRFEDGEVLNTATAWFWQDLRTRRVLAWRLAKTENTDLFRLATYDLTAVCAPRDVWVDNTRVAANKLMTAGAAGRHRFKSDPDDGVGLLLMLGMEPHFTNPDKEVGNPGAKPIERAFGIGGIHSEVASHPSFVGRGYSQATAISIAELRDVLTQEVARHNARTGRRTSECRGVLSFDHAWEAALVERPVRVLSDSQRRLLLMSREVVRADSRTGLLALDAGKGPHGRNRYWSEHLTEHAGRKLAVHFDPENLSTDVHIYTLDGRYLFAAQHQPTVAFNDTGAAREHAKFKQRRIKAQKAVADAEVRMNAIERASLYSAATGKPEPAKPARKRSDKVVTGVFQRAPDPARDAQAMKRTGTDDGPTALDLEMYRRATERKNNGF